MIEKIVHAAVLSECGGKFLIGKQHADCFHQADNMGFKLSSRADHQGFVTNKGRFVGREEAAKIALAAGQIDCDSEGLQILCSEDLWSPLHNGKFRYDYIKGYHQAPQWSDKKEQLLQRAHKIIKEGKAKFTPNTTNSFVDEWLRDYED